MAIRVTQLKPNPAGKDRGRLGSVSPAQLGAEWVDIKNFGGAPVDLAGTVLFHLAYGRTGVQPDWQKITSFNGRLPAGAVLRVHSGQSRDLNMLYIDDRIGADFHLFTGRDAFIWNNAEGDTVGLWETSSKSWADSASYDAYPPEGVILVRSGSKLIPAGIAARI